MNAFSLRGFEGALDAPSGVEGGLLFLFQGDRLLTGEDASLPHGRPEDFGGVRAQYLGALNGEHAFGAQHPGEAPAPFQFRRLRSLFGVLQGPLFALAAYAYQIVEWDRTFRFCGVCATETVRHPFERAKRCPNCGFTNYPRLSPAVMVLVTRGDEVLLSRSPHFQSGMYSANAGFLEPGENLEECARREVREEVGVEIESLRYFGSQPWPFPHSLMIAFTAEYAGGEVRPQEGEIEDARWFGVDELPLLPGPVSVARALIDWAVEDIRRSDQTEA